jgi:hypothetical protein
VGGIRQCDVRASDGLVPRARPCRPRACVERPERGYAHGARRRREEHVGDGEPPPDAVQQQEAEEQALTTNSEAITRVERKARDAVRES